MPTATETPANEAPHRLIDDVEFGEGVIVHSFTNLYGCRIGDRTRIGTFVEVQRGAEIGAACKIQSHTFICDGVTIGDEVFIGHGVMFVNDKRPRATADSGELQTEADWEMLRTRRRATAPRSAPGRRSSAGSRSDAARRSAPAPSSPRMSAPGETVVGNPARPRR